MAAIHHSTEKPVELSKEIVARVAKNHRDILETYLKSVERESTGNARSAVTKPSTIPPWASR